MYCVKCKRITGTSNIERFVTKNNRNMVRGRCDVCGIRKTQFIKADVGKGERRCQLIEQQSTY